LAYQVSRSLSLSLALSRSLPRSRVLSLALALSLSLCRSLACSLSLSLLSLPLSLSLSLPLSRSLSLALSCLLSLVLLLSLTLTRSKGSLGVAVCCSALQCVAVCCSVLQCVVQCVAVCLQALFERVRVSESKKQKHLVPGVSIESVAVYCSLLIHLFPGVFIVAQRHSSKPPLQSNKVCCSLWQCDNVSVPRRIYCGTKTQSVAGPRCSLLQFVANCCSLSQSVASVNISGTRRIYCDIKTQSVAGPCCNL